MRIGLRTWAKIMIGRIVGTGLRAQLPALQADLSKFVEYTSRRDVLFGCWLNFVWIECGI